MARTANSQMPLQLRRSALFVALAFPMAAIAHTEAPKRLDDVVVSASGFEQDIKEAPASISVISRQELETKQFRDLGEALAGIEGIDVHGGTGKTGGLSISFRGMPSDYTLILIDGRRQNVAGDATPNGFGSATNSFMPPVSAIERIEVIRGPMSTLYGSDAMGGVVNIITRKVAKEWFGSVGIEAGIPQDDKYAQTHKLNAYVSGPIKENVLGLTLRGSTMMRGNSDRIIENSAGRDPNPGKSRQHSFGTKLSLTPDTKNEFWLDLDHSYTWYSNSDCRLGTKDGVNGSCAPDPGTVSGYKDSLEFTRQQVAIGHKTRFDNGIWESSLMHSETETTGRTLASGINLTRPGATLGADRELKSSNVILDSKFTASLGQHTATIGGQWWDAKLVDGFLPKDQYTQNMYSLFVEDEWRFAKDFAATFGLRYDEHDKFGGHLSPRAYLVWNTTQEWTIKGGYSEGYKAPSIGDLIDGVAGVGRQGASLSIGNPNLKPETVRTTELSVLYSNQKGLTGSVTAFHNEFDDKIQSGYGRCSLDPISSCAANATATYAMNVDKAKTWGMEMATQIPLAERWKLGLNYTWTETELMEDGEVTGQLSNTPKHRANAQLRFTPNARTNLWLRAEYRGDSRRFTGNRLDEGETIAVNTVGSDLKGYALLHLGGTYKVSKTVTLGANVFNLLDKDFTRGVKSYAPDPSRPTSLTYANSYFTGGSSINGVSHLGRTFWLTANITF